MATFKKNSFFSVEVTKLLRITVIISLEQADTNCVSYEGFKSAVTALCVNNRWITNCLRGVLIPQSEFYFFVKNT